MKTSFGLPQLRNVVLFGALRSLAPLAVFGVMPLTAHAAEEAVLRVELATPLLAAQAALKAGNPAQALQLALPARGVPKLTVSERLVVERTIATSAMGAKDVQVLGEALTYLVAAPEIDSKERLSLLLALIDVQQKQKELAGLVSSAQQYLALGGANPTVRLMMVQSLSVLGRHAEVVKAVSDWVEATKPGAAPVQELALRAMAASQLKLNDADGYYRTLKLLVVRYPSQDYWIDLIGRLAKRPGWNPRYELDTYRLLEAEGGLEEADDILYMANLAIKLGLPAEALRVVDAGFQAKILGAGKDAVAHDKLKKQLMALVKEDEAAGAATASATAKLDGNGWIQRADVLASRGQWAEASVAYAKGFELGSLRREDEVRLHQGIALVKAKDHAAAIKALERVSGDATAVELASLWAIRAR
jgi:tetratricopeptide (TPR) repeat protein